MRRNTLCTAILLATAILPATSRAEWNDSIRLRAEVSANIGSGDHNPFWLSANQYGFASIEKNNLALRLSAFKDIDNTRKFSWGAGIDLGVAHRSQSTFIPQQLFAEVKYRALGIMAGAKEFNDSFLPQNLSSGALTAGWNARPIPQVRAGIFDYADFWGCRGWFAVKGHIAYGTFDDDWWIKRWASPDYSYALGTLYCSRAIFFRGGDSSRFPLTGELGLQMETQFGGKTWIPATDSKPACWMHNPRDFKAFAKALFPMKGGTDTPNGEQTNVQGNMLGNWSFALHWTAPAGWSLRAYYQHFFEDHSMLFFDYPWKDGLYGIHATLPENKFVSEILYEFLYSKDQSGPVYWDHTPDIDYQVSARDSYYNHYIYNGWQNWGQTVGNPLITSPIYNTNHQFAFLSNRIRANHFAIQGNPSPQVGWRLLATHTDSWGTYDTPYNNVRHNFSFLAEVKYHPRKLKGWEGTAAFAFDSGNIIGHSLGFRLAIAKTITVK